MSASEEPDTALAEAIAESDFAAEDLQELRLAMVMTGGVSLAVWMGGTALEVSRLIRGEDPTYLEALRLTRSLPRVDVIAGTSAGGLNGALLAYAISQDTSVAGLRELWLRLGALEKLLREPTKADPPSLMLGDDYFLPEIEKAIGALKNHPTKPESVPMDLTITTTLLNAWPRGVPDTFGTIIQDADHRGELTFRRGVSLSDVDPRPDDDFDGPDVEARLALAARCTACFPVAFEASYVPIGSSTSKPSRPDMTDNANFQRSRFVVDGGVLLNRPLRPALRAIFRQPASKQVRRVLAYVVPDPGEGMRVEPDVESNVPSLADIGLASMIRIPRNQSVSAELDELMQHNTRVDAQRRRRELVVIDLDVDDLARKAYPQYRGFRADLIAGWMLALLARGFTALELQTGPPTPEHAGVLTEAPLRERTRLREKLIAHLGNLPPGEFPRGGAETERWFTTVDTAERAAGVVLDLLRRGLAVIDPGEQDAAGLRRDIRRLRGLVSDDLTAAQATRARLTKDDELELARAAVLALREDDRRPGALRAWADGALPRVLGDPEKLEPIVVRIADQLMPAARAVTRACDIAPPHLKPRAEQTKRYAEAVVSGIVENPEATPTALHRLLALEVVQLALGGQPIVEQRVDLIQVSADAGNGLDLREQAEEKLAGLQLGHFGAFYKRSWRANDWMWGRHDAAQRLAQVLLEPARLRQLGFTVEQALDRIEKIAFEGLGAEDEETLRSAPPRRWDPEKAKEELSFLKPENAEDPAPATLPMSAQAVARRLQLGIAREELPELRKAIGWDKKDGAHVSTEAQQFCDNFDAAPKPLSAADAVRLFNACEVGRERIAAESGSDLLARTATRTLAVTTSAAGGETSGLPKLLRPPLRTLRGLTLMIYLVARHALEGSRAGAMIVTGALCAGAVLVGVGLVVRIPGILMIAGLGAVLGAVFLALWRKQTLWALAALVAGLAVALLPDVFGGWIWDVLDNDEIDRARPVSVVAGMLCAALILGRASFDWPAKAGKE